MHARQTSVSKNNTVHCIYAYHKKLVKIRENLHILYGIDKIKDTAMNRNKPFILVLLTAMLLFSVNSFAGETFQLRLFFGLSRPNGHGVSLAEWQTFEKDTLAKTFAGFNVVDSTGYYQGKPERCKIVTLICGEEKIKKAKALAGQYAKTFDQESVMMIKVPVLEWEFIEGKKKKP